MSQTDNSIKTHNLYVATNTFISLSSNNNATSCDLVI